MLFCTIRSVLIDPTGSAVRHGRVCNARYGSMCSALAHAIAGASELSDHVRGEDCYKLAGLDHGTVRLPL